MTLTEKANLFRARHHQGGVLLVPNPWDSGSARLLEHLGFEALATSSAAGAGTLARVDRTLRREEALSQIRLIAQAVGLPVTGDLENGFGHSPEVVAETLRLGAEAGLVGGSIEDSTGEPEKPQFDLGLAKERIAAAVEAARALPFPFTLTARAENYSCGSPDLEDTIRRLVAYADAGADVLFAPKLPDLAAVREVCAAVGKPVNFMVGIPGKSFSVEELAAAGVRRISFASSLYRAALTGLRNAAREVKTTGTFHFLEETLTSTEMVAIWKRDRPPA